LKNLIALLFLFSFTAEAAVVRVSSVYQDQAELTRKIRVNGSGFAFAHEASGKFFVFTASHVSQGEDLEIELGTKKLTIVKRQLHDFQDLELIEVSGVLLNEVDAKYAGGQIVYDMSRVSRKRVIDSYNFVPLLPWVNDPNLDADNNYNATRPSALYMDVLWGMLNGDSLVQPGTSGSPLVTVAPNRAGMSTLPYDVREGLLNVAPGTAVVRGIAIRRERFFSRAGFVHRPWLIDTLNKYLNNTASTAEFKWKARGGILYRELDLYIETASTSGATAGGTLTDVGNGVTMDGGDLATLGEDSPKDFLSKVSALPIREGEPLRLLMFTSRHPVAPHPLISFLAWFDMEFYTRLRRFLLALKDQPGVQRDMVGDFNVRLNKTTPYEIHQPQYLNVDANLLTGRISEGGDVIEFQINRHGAQCVNGTCEPKFQPVIEVVSKNGLPYIIDIKEMFYVDLGGIQVPGLTVPGAEALDADGINAKIYDELATLYVKPRIHYRRKKTSVDAMTVQQGMRKTVQWTR